MITTTGVIKNIDYSPSGEVVILHVKVTEPFDFVEGQFMLLQTLIDGKIIKRSYSISSTNQYLQDHQIISFSIKRKENGVFSTRATKVAKSGMSITMTGPLGKFIDRGLSKKYLFISVWSGLSPVYSIYTHLLRTGAYAKMVNLFGEKTIEHIPLQVLVDYSIQSDMIYNQICLSRQKNISDTVTMRSWYVQGAIDDALLFLGDDIMIYVCGMPSMCDDVREILLWKGIEKERICIEKY